MALLADELAGLARPEISSAYIPPALRRQMAAQAAAAEEATPDAVADSWRVHDWRQPAAPAAAQEADHEAGDAALAAALAAEEGEQDAFGGGQTLCRCDPPPNAHSPTHKPPLPFPSARCHGVHVQMTRNSQGWPKFGTTSSL